MPLALLSVHDKHGLEPFARGLVDLGFELVSTGGTLATLTAAGLPVRAVSDVTGFPEILGGRVKTLHPRIHGGILARREPSQLGELAAHGIAAVDVVVSNLYPFRQTVARPNVSEAEALEQIDIGGPAMLRAAAKNHPGVVVVVDPGDYDQVLNELKAGMSAPRRRELAHKAFAHTAAYDAAIAAWFAAQAGGAALPERLQLSLVKAEQLRYGENPHQEGARYREEGTAGGAWDTAVLHSGLALSYLNLFDAEAAWRLAHELSALASGEAVGSGAMAGASCVIVKHANACGAALGGDLAEAYAKAFAADPKSAFGGVVALPGQVDEQLAQAIASNPKADVLIAHGYSQAALQLLARKRKNMRVLSAPAPTDLGLELRRIDGGFLVQLADRLEPARGDWQVVTRRSPTEAQWRDLVLANLVCARTSSNAIVLAKDGAAVGIGAGQQSRVDSVEIAARKAAGRAGGSAAASDAFFPFRDGVDALAAAGVAAVVQPGGSVKDAEIVAAADEHGIAMVMTGLRHFRH